MQSQTKKYIIEGSLIVFSVLFALFINKTYDDYKLRQKKKIALASVKLELNKNLEILTIWRKKHLKMHNNLLEVVEGRNDSLIAELRKYKFLNVGLVLGNESLIYEFLTNSAWESMKVSGIISELDFKVVQDLTHAHDLQKILTEKTLQNIIDFYFSKEAHNIENLEAILLQFHLRFSELIGQEAVLRELLLTALEQTK